MKIVTSTEEFFVFDRFHRVGERQGDGERKIFPKWEREKVEEKSPADDDYERPTTTTMAMTLKALLLNI